MTASASAASHSKTAGNSFLRAIKSGDAAFCLCPLSKTFTKGGKNVACQRRDVFDIYTWRFGKKGKGAVVVPASIKYLVGRGT